MGTAVGLVNDYDACAGVTGDPPEMPDSGDFLAGILPAADLALGPLRLSKATGSCT